MQLVSAFLAAVGLVGTVLGIVSWYSSYAGTAQRRDSILFTIIAGIIFFTFLFGYLFSVFGNNSSSTQNVSTNVHQSHITPTLGKTPTTKTIPTPTTAPTPTPTPFPTPTPTPFPQSGTVLYKADWSSGMNGWAGGDDWKTSSGLLLNDGTQSNSIILAPYNPGNSNIADYAVETVIQFVRHSDEGALGGLDSFGVIVRSPDGQKGYEFSACASAGFFSCGSNSVEIFISNGSQNIAENPYVPQKGSTHTFRMEVKGNKIKVLIDSRLFLQATDNTFLSGGQVGLFSNRSQITIRSFTVTA